MKVIDLLNKIANGEEVPERIKYDTKEMKYDHNKQDYLGYYSNGNGEWLFQYLFDRCRNTEHFINNEVEVIENKRIEKTGIWFSLEKDCENNNVQYANHNFEIIFGKLDEIIDRINKGE